MAKPTKIATYNLGDKGVVITKSPVHGQDGELAKAQNAVPNPEGGLSGIKKRIGFLPINASAAAGAIYSFISLSLDDPGTAISAQFFGKFLYTDDGGATWSYLNVIQSSLTPPDIVVSGSKLAYLHRNSSGEVGQVANTDPGWDGEGATAAPYDPGREPFVMPHQISVGGKMYYWPSTNAGAIRTFDGENDTLALTIAGVTSLLDWDTDGTYIYVLADVSGTQKVYKVTIAGYANSQLGADVPIDAVCLCVMGANVYVGGSIPDPDPWSPASTPTLSSIYSIAKTGGAWAQQDQRGAQYHLSVAMPAYDYLQSANPSIPDGTIVVVGDQSYRAVTAFGSYTTIGDFHNGSLSETWEYHLARAINGTGGTSYHNGTPANALCSATPHAFYGGNSEPDYSVHVASRTTGIAGNGIPVTSSDASLVALNPTTDYGVEIGNVYQWNARITDIVGGTDTVYAAYSDAYYGSKVLVYGGASWSVAREMNQTFGYVGIWADGDECLLLETPEDIQLNVSKGVKLGTAVFFLTATGAVSDPVIALIALDGGELKRMVTP